MKSVLIVVFDGLQPKQVTQELTPNLASYIIRGVTFANHHSVFPSVTRVNSASMVTGRYPGGHGIGGNTMVFRDFDPDHATQVMEPELSKIAEKTGQVLLAPTLADILSRDGQEYIAIGVGTSGNAYLHNPNAERSGGAVIHPDFTLPHDLYDEIIDRFGPWPEVVNPLTSRFAHAVGIMTEYVLPERMPAVSLIWSSEPDNTQHKRGVGSRLCDRALHAADEQFGRLMRWLKSNRRADDTDVIVLSDHGYSTIQEVIDVKALVHKAGFLPGETQGGVVVAPNGGSVLFYIHERSRETAERLTAWLMQQPWCGTLTVSGTFKDILGTLPASLVGNEGPRAPDITMAFRWNSDLNSAGYQGHVYSASGTRGLGQHGSMSKHELRNVMFAWRPSFREGVTLHTPSSNADLAPTILRVLGIATDIKMDGRILGEGLADTAYEQDVGWSAGIHDSGLRTVGRDTYQQRIKISHVGSTLYVDEGNRRL